MKKAQIVSAFVGGALAVVIIGVTVIGVATSDDKKETTTKPVATTTQTTVEATTTQPETTEPISQTVTSTTKTPFSRKIPETTKVGDTTSSKSAEELEAEYQEEYNRLLSSRDERVAQYQSDMDRCNYPNELPANATQDEIDIYNQNFNGVKKEREMLQRCIDGERQMCDGEIKRLNERYGK